MDGTILKAYIENQKKPKLHVAKALGMSKQNLYQLFDSNNFNEETIKNIESVFKAKWGAIKASVNIDSNIATPEIKVKDGQGNASTVQLLETINLLVRQNDKLADTNRILAEKITTIPVGDQSETQRSVDAMLQGLRELLIKVAVGTRYKSPEEARSAYRKELGDVLKKNGVRDTQRS
jgi:hypothetical protein